MIITTDFIVGLDPTGFTTITGAQLAQLVNSANPQTDKGMCILTTDTAGVPEVPDASTTTKWQRYLWVRQSVSSVSLYVWNNNIASDVTYLKWQSTNVAGIGAGSIINSMIADNTIQDAKIANLSYSKLLGAPTGLPPSGAAGGDLTGTFPNPTIAANAITTAKIADANITSAKLVDATVAVGKLAPVSGSAKDMARVNAGATGMEAFTPPVIFTSGVVVPTANALKIPQVNSGATDFQMVAATTLGRLIASTFASNTTTQTAGAASADSATVNYNGTGSTVGFNSGAITPLRGTDGSKHIITVIVPLRVNLTNFGWVWLYNATGATAPLAAMRIYNGAGAISHGCVVLRWQVTLASNTAVTYYVNFGGGGTAGNIQICANAETASITVEEYI